MSKIYIPYDSKFDLERAKELAHLTEESYNFYRKDQEKQTWEPEKTGILYIPLDAGNDSSKFKYSILATFRFTGFWLTRPETVPFGFIAKRTFDDGNVGIFIVFRGTEESQEWYQNFNSYQENFLDVPELGLVHAGSHRIYTRAVKNRDFYYSRFNGDGNLYYVKHQYPDFIYRDGHPEAIAETIQKTLADTTKCPVNSPVFLTGHSLGGSLATFAALHIATQSSFKPILYTFASPRVGNPDFTNQFATQEIESYRIANSEDIVPTLPIANFSFTKVNPMQNFFTRLLGNRLTTMDTNYQHVGEPIYFSQQLGSIFKNHDMKLYQELL